mmetsp:Transcript_27404/g.49330  ORF Transcript_27404/g.49330 Transcript_27404/m.49330 type:complete len:219 (-) Transcript_27404:34-690(-)
MAQTLEISQPEEAFRLIRERSFSSPVVLSFVVPDYEPCEVLRRSLREFGEDSGDLWIAYVNTRALPDLGVHFSVTSVPTTFIFVGLSPVVKVEGAELHSILGPLEEITTNFNARLEEVRKQVTSRCEGLIRQSKMTAFIKGTKTEPRCKFTRRLLELLRDYDFTTFDILNDEIVREWLKRISNWPTYPQVYIDGELVGGLDIVEEMLRNCELNGLLGI